jgi:hypothetical protein
MFFSPSVFMTDFRYIFPQSFEANKERNHLKKMSDLFVPGGLVIDRGSKTIQSSGKKV